MSTISELEKLWINHSRITGVKRGTNGEPTMISEKIKVSKEVNGKLTIDEIWLPIRNYNFEWAYREANCNFDDALKLCKERCFDVMDDPKYMPTELGFKSYGALRGSYDDKTIEELNK